MRTHRELGDAVRVPGHVAGHPRYPDPQLGRPGDVDLLEANPELMHEAERPGVQYGPVDRGSERAHHRHAVQVLGDLPRRAGDDLPLREQPREITPVQVGGEPLQADEQPVRRRHGNAASNSSTGLRLPA
jgi:hypothetical protein